MAGWNAFAPGRILVPIFVPIFVDKDRDKGAPGKDRDKDRDEDGRWTGRYDEIGMLPEATHSAGGELVQGKNPMSAISSLFRKTRCHLINVQRIIRAQSSFKMVFVLCFATALEAGLWLLFLDGFRFLEDLGGVGVIIIGRLFSLFFLGMGLMLVVSGIVTSYSTIFRSDEVPFLVVKPFRMSQIVSYKFIESTALSSWAFFFIIIPFAGAYAWHEKMSVLFALWTFLFSLPFLVLCSGLGTIVTMLFVRWVPRRRGLRVCGLVLGIAVCLLLWHMSRSVYDPSRGLQFNLTSLVPGLKLASNAFSPGWWVSEGIMSLTRGQWFRGTMLWGVVLSTAMTVYICVEWLGGIIFYEGWQRVIGSGGRRRGAPVLLVRLERYLSFIADDVRALALKDIRIFLRDPMQWSQVLIFFGLLALYFANLRSLHYDILADSWRNTIAFLNVFSVSAVMCSLGSRFIYPQLSLEGQGFWVLGPSPVSMTKILLTKFVLSLAGMLTVSVALMLLSSGMLNAAPGTKTLAVILASAVSLAICGLSTGLGAVFLDLNQRNPAAIVSGFGGTLNLVLSLGFMLAVISPFGLVFHLRFIHKLSQSQLVVGLLLSGIWLFVITTIATIVPLWIGSRSLERREF